MSQINDLSLLLLPSSTPTPRPAVPSCSRLPPRAEGRCPYREGKFCAFSLEQCLQPDKPGPVGQAGLERLLGGAHRTLPWEGPAHPTPQGRVLSLSPLPAQPHLPQESWCCAGNSWDRTGLPGPGWLKFHSGPEARFPLTARWGWGRGPNQPGLPPLPQAHWVFWAEFCFSVSCDHRALEVN